MAESTTAGPDAVGLPDPLEDWHRIRGVQDGHQRAAQDRRSAPFQHGGKHVEFAGLRNRNRSSGKRRCGEYFAVCHGPTDRRQGARDRHPRDSA